ncbi:MAG: AsmA family protein [Endozoicomonas sp. (ex Botrylloides leachii)]|nr:AsmA family protein [Endozoicomonas sp. (ex Botrylloides leachii)]
MSRVLRWIAIFLAGLVLLICAAAILLPKVINPNDYRDDITKLVYEKTGLTLKVNGPIEWSVFPWFGLSIQDVSVAGTEGRPLAKLGDAKVSIELLPLLNKKLNVETANLTDVDLDLVRNEDGRGNWEIHRPVHSNQSGDAASQKTSVNKTISKTSHSNPFQLDIASIKVTGFKMSYDDRVTNNFYTIDKANFTTGAIANQKPFSIDIDAVISSKSPDITFRSKINGALTLNLKEGSYDLDNFTATVYPNIANTEKLSMKGDIQFKSRPLMVQGDIDFPTFNPKKLFADLGSPLPPMMGQNALDAVSFSTHLQSNGKSLNLSKIKLKVDNFSLNGFFTVTDFNKQAANFKFTGSNINLNDYMSVTTKEKNSHQNQSTAVTEVKQMPLIPENLLKGLNVIGSISLASMKADKLTFDQPSLKIKSLKGIAHIDITSKFYEGTIKINNIIDVNEKNLPKLSSDAHLKRVNLQSMANSIPALNFVQGVVNADMSLKTQGQFKSALMHNLNGVASFVVDQGAFTGANFNKMVCESIAKIRKKKLENAQWSKETEFQNLSGTLVIRNGIAMNNDLIADLSILNFRGYGQINLVDQSLDYNIDLNLRGDEPINSDPVCQIHKDYVDITWPIHCHGKIGEQTCNIDKQRLAQTIKDLARKSAQQRIKKEIDKHLDGSIKDALQGLFK